MNDECAVAPEAPCPEDHGRVGIIVRPWVHILISAVLVNAESRPVRVGGGGSAPAAPIGWTAETAPLRGSTRAATAIAGPRSAPVRRGRATCHRISGNDRPGFRPVAPEPAEPHSAGTASPLPQSNNCINRFRVLFRRGLRSVCAPPGSAWLARADALSCSWAWSTATIFSSSPRSSHTPRHRSQVSTTTPTRVRSWSSPPHRGQSMLRAPFSTGAPNKKTPRGD